METNVGISKHIFLLGRISNEPRFWTNNSGHLECDLTIARIKGCLHSTKSAQVCWHRVRLAGRHAEYARIKLRKGDAVSVSGRIIDLIEAAPNGFTKHSTLVLAHKLRLIGQYQKRSPPTRGQA